MPPPLPKPEGFVAWGGGGGGVSSKGTLEFRTRFGFFFFLLSSKNLLNVSAAFFFSLPSDGLVGASRGPNISTGSLLQLFI